MDHTYDDALFRQQFIAFANPVTYPAGTISNYFTMATIYMGKCDWCLLNGDELQLALNILTAHLMQLGKEQASGNTSSGIVDNATIDKVSVGLQVPQGKNAWQMWLAKTGYGLQLWALLSMIAAGGFYIGGSTERMGFRKARGRF